MDNPEVSIRIAPGIKISYGTDYDSVRFNRWETYDEDKILIHDPNISFNHIEPSLEKLTETLSHSARIFVTMLKERNFNKEKFFEDYKKSVISFYINSILNLYEVVTDGSWLRGSKEDLVSFIESNPEILDTLYLLPTYLREYCKPENIQIELQIDPECGDKTITVTASIKADLNEVLQRMNKFDNEWWLNRDTVSQRLITVLPGFI